jgi:leucyl aminopeptidase
VDADAVALLLCEDEAAPPEVNAQWAAELNASGEFTGKAGEMAVAPFPQGFKAKRLLLVGGGKRDKFDSAALRKAVGSAVRSMKAKGAKKLAWVLAGGDAEGAAEGAVLANFEPDHHKASVTRRILKRLFC